MNTTRKTDLLESRGQFLDAKAEFRLAPGLATNSLLTALSLTGHYPTNPGNIHVLQLLSPHSASCSAPRIRGTPQKGTWMGQGWQGSLQRTRAAKGNTGHVVATGRSDTSQQ